MDPNLIGRPGPVDKEVDGTGWMAFGIIDGDCCGCCCGPAAADVDVLATRCWWSRPVDALLVLPCEACTA